MLVSFIGKVRVDVGLVREHRGTFGNKLLDDGHKGLRLRVRNDKGTHRSLAFSHTEDRGLGLEGTTRCVLCPLGVVLVDLATAEVHLVRLHLALKDGSVVLFVQGADLVEYEPRGLLRDAEVTAQLMGGNALFVAGDEVHRDEPFPEGNLGVLKDGTDRDGEILPAFRATVCTVLPGPAMVPTAEGADDVILLPAGVADGSFTPFLGAEEGGQLKDGIEAGEINHRRILLGTQKGLADSQSLAM